MPDNIDLPPLSSSVDLLDLQRQTEQATHNQRILNAEIDISRQLGRQFGHALTTAFVGIAVQGKGLGDVLRSLAQNLSKLALNAAFKPLENVFGGALQAAVSGGFGQSAGAALVAGGPMPFSGSGGIASPASFPIVAGSSVSPMMLSQSATPVEGSGNGRSSGPLGKLGSVNVTFHVSSPDAESFRRSETQIAAMLARTVGTGQRNL